MPTCKLYLAILLCLLFTNHTYSAEFFTTDSIKIQNNGPILNLYHFSRPDIMGNQREKSITLKSQFELSNYISSTSKNGDEFSIDGESWVVRNTLNYQATSNLIISASLPWIKHTEGKADSFIYKFHDLLQLPQNGRTEDRQNELRWILNKDGKTLLDVDSELSSWGDLSITAQLTPENSPSVRWSFMTKLPTGNYEKQTGSEEFDVGASFAQINPDWFKNRPFLSNTKLAFWYGSGVTYLGETSALEDLGQNSYMLTFRTGFAYSPIQAWHLKCQLDAQTPLFDTGIRELGWAPVQISFSTQHQLSEKTKFEFVIIEDIRPRSTPDVVFLTNIQTTF